MKKFSCYVILESGFAYNYIIEAKNRNHAKNKLQIKLEYEGLCNIYNISIEQI